ncbi:MAG: hypothetical protein ABIR92_10240 [Gemmatimonadaceae bacterium]
MTPGPGTSIRPGAPPVTPPRTTIPVSRPTPMDSRPTPAIPVQRQTPGPMSLPPAARGPAAPETPPGRKTPINPFLANDPNAKARRLARALISDLITYFPAKRDEGIRDGTLKEVFKEEIKKSYHEYSDQVGKEFAETTEHFRNALNEILAGGNQIF